MCFGRDHPYPGRAASAFAGGPSGIASAMLGNAAHRAAMQISARNERGLIPLGPLARPLMAGKQGKPKVSFLSFKPKFGTGGTRV